MVCREYYITFKTRHVCSGAEEYAALVPRMHECIESVFGKPHSLRKLLRLQEDTPLPPIEVTTAVSHVNELVAQIGVSIEGQDVAITKGALTTQAKAAAEALAQDKFVITSVTCQAR